MGRVCGVVTGVAVIGIGIGFAVALDAFLLRFILVPAVMYVLGRQELAPAALAEVAARYTSNPQNQPEGLNS